jgi:holo-[acyl-carrier protein] synthase
MILGIGTDIVKIERFTNSRSHMDQLANKLLTDFELAEYQTITNQKDNFLAKRWAAKEAISKSFGTGISADTRWKSIEIRHNKQTGAPFVCFYGELKNTVETLQARCHLSLSDDADVVVAYAVIDYRN